MTRLRSIAAHDIAGEKTTPRHLTSDRLQLDPDDLPREYRFYRFVTKRLKVFDEREFGGAMFVTAAVGRDHPR